MRIPLIVSSRPTEETIYPRVALRAGRWRFSSTHTDSLLRVNAPDQSVELHEELVLPVHSYVTVSCLKRGTEQSITIYAHVADSSSSP